MKILYIGAGFVGASSAAVSADSGHEVLVYDRDADRIARLSSGDKDTIEACLFEDGLGELIVRSGQRLEFTADYGKVENFLNEAEAVFLCLPTPEKDSTGETDMSYYEAAVRELGRAMARRSGGKQDNYVLVVNKSTVPVETVGLTDKMLSAAGARHFGVGANPEFLVEGKAVEGSIRPQRIVVGAWSEDDFAVCRRIYKRFFNAPNVVYIEVNPVEAAAGKLLANYALFSRLAVCFDVVGRACEVCDNIRYEKIRRIVTTDKRIGDWGFYDSLFAGGSCFIKDARSLAFQLKSRGAGADLVEGALAANARQLERFLNRPLSELGFDYAEKTVALLGLAFKRDTNDVRNAAALGAARYLLDSGVKAIRAYDPVATPNFFKAMSDHPKIGQITEAGSETEAIRGADAILIATDWPQFRELAGLIKANSPAGAVIMDGRRMLESSYDDLSVAGYRIVAVGSPAIRASRNV